MSTSSEKTSVPTTRHLFRQISVSLKQSNSGHKKTNKIQSQKHMKPKSILTALAVALLAPGALFAQTTATTTPVGYVTQTVRPNIANLIGINLHNAAVASGVIDASTSSSITDTQINFTTLLTAGKSYILEISGSPDNGVIEEIATWDGSTLNTTANLTSYITNGTTTYKLREASTIGGIFGANNTFGLTPSTDGDTTACDTILVLNAAGDAFVTCFYYDDGSTQTWFDLDFNEVTNLPLIYADSLYVSRVAGQDKDIVITGEVKTTKTNISLASGNNFVGSVYPAGATFGNSGLSASLAPSTDGDTAAADTVLLPQADGSYLTCFYYDDGSTQSWFDLDFNDITNEPLTPGLVIQNKGNAKNATITPPAAYNQ